MLLKKASDYIDRFDPEATPKELTKEISAYKKEVAVLRQNNLERFNAESDTSNFNIYILYQTILQETQQMADDLKHLIRAYTYLSTVKGK